MLNLRIPPGRALLAAAIVAALIALALWLGSQPEPASELEATPPLRDAHGAAGVAPELDDVRSELARTPEPSAALDLTAAVEPSASESAFARIVGRVFDSGGSPLPAAHVLAAAPEGDLFAPSFSAVSDREGWYELREVAPGTYELGVRPAGVALGSTVLERIEVEPGDVAVADLALRGARTVRGGFEFADSWEDMDLSLVRVVLWRRGEWGGAVARAFCFTSHAEPWRSGSFRFEGLEPGVYVLEAWPFVEEHAVWRGEVDLTREDASLPCRALGEDRVWRERAAVEPPPTAWSGPARD